MLSKVDPLQAYKIGFTGLSIGSHLFSFEIDRSFFDCFEQSEISECAVTLDLNIEKETSMLILDFAFSGWVAMECNRCLDSYREYISIEDRIYVKFGDSYSEKDENVVIIPYGDTHFNISQFVYEFMHLGLPIRRVHPVDEQGVSACNEEMIRKMQQHAPGSGHSQKPDNQTPSAWDALKSLKFNNEDKRGSEN